MDYNWLLFAGLAGALSSAFNFLNRYILKGDEDATSYGWYFELVRFIFFTAISFNSIFANYSFKTYFLLIASGLIEVLSVYIYMKMHSNSELSISAIISRTRLIWVPIFAFVFLGERLIFKEYVGLGILFLGVVTVISPRKISFDKGVKLAALSAIIVSIGSVVLKELSSTVPAPVTMVYISFPSVFMIPFLMKGAKIRLSNSLKTNKLVKAIAIFANVFAMFFYVNGLKFGEVSKVSAIYQSMAVLSVVTGVIFLKERKDVVKKMLGAVVVVFGILIMTL